MRDGGSNPSEWAKQVSKTNPYTGVAQLAERSVDSAKSRKRRLVEFRAGGREVGGSIPSPRTKFSARWCEELPCKTGVYVRRWFIETPIGSIRLHHWLHSDDARYHHDHTWWFLTFILKGGYRDVSPTGTEHMTAGHWAYRPALHQHTVQVDPGGCWTLLITGPVIRRWGFWVKGKWKKSNKYFLKHGKHVCD